MRKAHRNDYRSMGLCAVALTNGTSAGEDGASPGWRRTGPTVPDSCSSDRDPAPCSTSGAVHPAPY